MSLLRQIRLSCVHPCISRRFLGYSESSRTLQSGAPHATEDRDAESISTGPMSFSPRVHPTVERIIRVNHAGEFGAERIYAGQAAVLENSSVGPVIQVNHAHDAQPLQYKPEIIRNCIKEAGTRLLQSNFPY